jgi:hypothetical protein
MVWGGGYNFPMAVPSPWNLILLIGALLFFAGISLGHIFFPDYFVRRSGMRRGGEMLTVWNRMGVRFVGAVILGAIVCVVYIAFIEPYFKVGRLVPHRLNLDIK